MFFSKLFGMGGKSVLGVDIGTSNIKIVQVAQGDTPILETYGIVNNKYRLGGKNDELAVSGTANALKSLVGKAGATTKRCVISFPNSSVFTSVISLPKMPDRELAVAVEFEAKKYVPLALSEIDLSWEVISGESRSDAGSQLKILLTAVPKKITSSYMRVFALAGLHPEVGEVEALALIRSLIGGAKANCAIIDIGARTTGLVIIEQGFLRLSRNLNIGGDTITDKVSESLQISQSRAEQFKKDFGVGDATFIPDAIRPLLAIIKNEVKQILAIYQSQNIKVEKILVVGGGASLPGIIGFFEDLGITVELGNPFASVGYSKALEPVVKRYALSLPVAIGLALRKE